MRAAGARLSPLAGADRLRDPVELASAARDKYFPPAESGALLGAAPHVGLTVTPALADAEPRIPLCDLRGLAEFCGFGVRGALDRRLTPAGSMIRKRGAPPRSQAQRLGGPGGRRRRNTTKRTTASNTTSRSPPGNPRCAAASRATPRSTPALSNPGTCAVEPASRQGHVGPSVPITPRFQPSRGRCAGNQRSSGPSGRARSFPLFSDREKRSPQSTATLT
jgi:hypothetical protein